MHLSLAKRFPVFILASSVCWSLQCLISALIQEGKGGHLFRLTCSVMLWGGRITANKYHWHVWGVLAVSRCTGFAPAHGTFTFPVHSSQALGCCAGELSEAGRGLCALPRSKGSGSGRSSSCDQVLGEHSLPRWGVHLITSPVPAARFPGWQRVCLSQVCCVSLLGS